MKTMHFSKQLTIFAVLCACASAATYSVTSAAEDYFMLAQRQLTSDISVAEFQIAAVEARSKDRISVIASQHMAVLQEIHRAEQSLAPLQALSIGRKHCIQKFKSKLISLDTAKKEFAVCIATAQVRIGTLTTTAKASLTAAKTASTTALASLVATCNTTHAANKGKLEECVIAAVETASKTVLGNLNTVTKNLEASLCTSSDISQDAVQCSFETEKNALENIGSVLDSISSCIKEADKVCNCPPDTKNLKAIVMGAKNI